MAKRFYKYRQDFLIYLKIQKVGDQIAQPSIDQVLLISLDLIPRHIFSRRIVPQLIPDRLEKSLLPNNAVLPNRMPHHVQPEVNFWCFFLIHSFSVNPVSKIDGLQAEVEILKEVNLIQKNLH